MQYKDDTNFKSVVAVCVVRILLWFLLGTGRMQQGQRSSQLDTALSLCMLEKFLMPGADFRILVLGFSKLRSLLSAPPSAVPTLKSFLSAAEDSKFFGFPRLVTFDLASHLKFQASQSN